MVSVLTRRAHSALVPVLVLAVLGCEIERTREDATPTFEEVGPVLSQRCGACHSGDDAEAGYAVDRFLDAIACVPDGRAATLADAAGVVPLLAALDRDDHAGFITGDERALLRLWVAAGAPARVGFVHPAGVIDPRSADWHGALATRDGYRRMLDASLDDACGRCHAGAPAQPGGDGFQPLDGATDCRTCHSEPGGPLACGTCHGQGADPLPPRDNCYFPGGTVAGAHDVHLQSSGLFPAAISCGHCHPSLGAEVLSGRHGDGQVDVVLPDALEDWEPAAFDPETGACTGRCHGVATVSWTATASPEPCQGCHSSPPPEHPPRPCGDCHRGVADDGTALWPGAPHLDGRVDLGDGTGRCGTCHGDGADDGWPESGAHSAHRDPARGAPVACETCHVVPDTVDVRGHIDDTSAGAEIAFGGVATALGATPSYADGTCTGTACHARPGAALPNPRWDERLELDCGSCHATPPAPPHTTWNLCSARACHGGEVIVYPDGPDITAMGRDLHVDGTVNTGLP